MNEQIQNLKDKIWADEYWTKPNTDKLLPAQLNRFAELIVRECIEQVITGPNGPAHYAVEAALRLKKHFGVEL